MTTKTLFRWEQDANGGEHGNATYFPGAWYEVTVTLPNFEQAHALQARISDAIYCARWDVHREVTGAIARIEP